MITTNNLSDSLNDNIFYIYYPPALYIFVYFNVNMLTKDNEFNIENKISYYVCLMLLPYTFTLNMLQIKLNIHKMTYRCLKPLAVS